MPVSGFMTAKAVMPCLNPKRGIAAYIALMARLPVRRYKKEMAAVRLRQKIKKGLGKRYIMKHYAKLLPRYRVLFFF